MSVNLGSLGQAFLEIRADLKGLDKSLREVDRKVTGALSGTVNRSGQEFMRLGNIIKAAFAVKVIKDVGSMADAMTRMQSKIRLVTKSQEELKNVQNELIDLAHDTRTDLASTVALYTRLAQSADRFGGTQKELLLFTRAVSQAMQISGATAAEAAGSITQLTQAIAATLGGEELRSIREQAPRLARAIAEGLGVGVGDLKKLGEEGKLVAEIVFPAIISQAGKLHAEFQKVEPTIQSSFTQLKNGLTVAIGLFIKGTGAASGLTSKVEEISKALIDNKSNWERWGTSLGNVIDKIVKSRAVNNLALIARHMLLSNPFTQPLGLALSGEPKKRRLMNKKSYKGTETGGRPVPALPIEMEEFNVTLQKLGSKSETFLNNLRKSVRTATISSTSDFYELKESLNVLVSEGLMNAAEASKIFSKALDESLEEIDLNEIKAKYKPVEQATSELMDNIGFIAEDGLTAMVRDFEHAGDIMKQIVKEILVEIVRLNLIKPFVAWATSGISTIFGMASGGPVSANRPYVVGEEGPELFVPSLSGNIVPNNKLGRMGGGRGGGVFQQNINIPLAFPPQLESYIRTVAAPAGRDAAIQVMRVQNGRL